MLRPSLFVPPLLFALCSCHINLREGIVVDGVRLRAHHEEVLTLESWPEGGLHIESKQGDVRVEPCDGATSLTVDVFERSLGQAHAVLENGHLLARAENGEPCAIGRVVLRVNGPIRGNLALATGMGDVELSDVEVEGELDVESGMGDIDLARVGAPASIELATGMGDVELSGARCSRLRASSGMGDVRVDELDSPEAELTSGLGDVSIARSRFTRVKADTGMGDIDCKESSFESSDFDSGLGSVRTR